MASSGVSDEEMNKQFLGAASSGDLRLLKHVVKNLSKGDKEIAETVQGIRCPDGLCALHYAAAGGKTEICEYLVQELRIPVDFRSEDGKTLLHYAAMEGRSVTVKYLIKQGADPATTDKRCSTPLFDAASYGHAEVVKVLLSRGVHVDAENHRGTALHHATSHGHDNVMKILFQHGADINKLMSGLISPLQCCIMAGSLKCAKLLIKAGADVNLGCPLGMAAYLNEIETIKCLLEAGVDPNIPNLEDDQLPIEVAAMSDRKEIVEILFPLTSPISHVKCWSIEGLYKYVHSDAFHKKSQGVLKKKSVNYKKKGAEAFKRKDFMAAILFYNGAIVGDSTDATLFSNRSISYLKAGFGEHALTDACLAQSLRPDWPKAYYRVGAALMLLKDYEKASQAFQDALKLDPTNEEISTALRSALGCMGNFEQ